MSFLTAVQEFLTRQGVNSYHPGLATQFQFSSSTTLPLMQFPAGMRPGLLLPPEIENPDPNSSGGSYVDPELNVCLESDLIGVAPNGWNVRDRQTEWVSFDIDVKPPKKKGIPKYWCNNLEHLLSPIPHIRMVRSTSGTGLHIYVFMDKPVPTQNFSQHRAISCSVLRTLTGMTSTRLSSFLTHAGRPLWIWHREKMREGSFELVKDYSEHFPTNVLKCWEC